ncbi:hypothetical protein EWM64_g7429 [Hericium alpestre]|uniref:Uncharacterized protein n=1 Tax=Hericium alpestre TaxID=135208 RepID=A0A4Y9ZRD0_9AGAM|nr:hypothetical protein EWM64_g7429 [Hericium alpestre]
MIMNSQQEESDFDWVNDHTQYATLCLWDCFLSTNIQIIIPS